MSNTTIITDIQDRKCRGRGDTYNNEVLVAMLLFCPGTFSEDPLDWDECSLSIILHSLLPYCSQRVSSDFLNHSTTAKT